MEKKKSTRQSSNPRQVATPIAVVTGGMFDVEQLAKEVKKSGTTLSLNEARYLVDMYYQIQEGRKAGNNQARDTVKAGEQPQILVWAAAQHEKIEKAIKATLDVFSETTETGRWAKSICGIGEVLSSGLSAYYDPKEDATVSKMWRYFGQDPTTHKRVKGEKLRFNPACKVLAWKIGESFLKVYNKEQDFYGKLIMQRRERDNALNESGHYAETAKEILAAKKFDKTTEAYKAYIQGKLPPGHILARAKRFAAKIFLAHWLQVCYYEKYKKKLPRGWVFEHGGHVDEIMVPNWPFEIEQKHSKSKSKK